MNSKEYMELLKKAEKIDPEKTHRIRLNRKLNSIGYGVPYWLGFVGIPFALFSKDIFYENGIILTLFCFLIFLGANILLSFSRHIAIRDLQSIIDEKEARHGKRRRN